MATIRNLIVSTLQTDAKLTTAGHLGHASLINKASSAPYGIFNVFPPEKPDFPLLTYQFTVGTGRRPEIMIVTFTAWGDSCIDILERVYDLFHRQEAVFATATDYVVFACLRDWTGPDIQDANFRVWVRSERYLLKAFRK